MNRRLLMLTVLAALASSAVIFTPATASANIEKRRDSAARDYLRGEAETGRFAGAVAVARGDSILFRDGFGLANLETGERNALDTKFNLASLGKIFTRIAILQLAQSGKIDMNATVGRYLPDFPNRDVREKVTIQQLYDMKGGLGSYWNARFFEQRTQLRTIDDYVALFASDPLLFEPGSRSSYSNAGYILLGKLIEEASGLSYDDYVRRHITQPAGLTDTGHFALDEVVPKLAIGYTAMPIGGPGGSAHGSAAAAPAGARIAHPGGTAHGPVAAIAPGKPVKIAHGAAMPNNVRVIRPNTGDLPGRGLSAGGGYSSVRDLLKLTSAIRANKLIDPAHTARLLGQDYMAVAGGFPGASTQLTMFPDGMTIVVLSNRDMPIASDVSVQLAKLYGKQLKPVGPSVVVRPRQVR